MSRNTALAAVRAHNPEMLDAAIHQAWDSLDGSLAPYESYLGSSTESYQAANSFTGLNALESTNTLSVPGQQFGASTGESVDSTDPDFAGGASDHVPT